MFIVIGAFLYRPSFTHFSCCDTHTSLTFQVSRLVKESRHKHGKGPLQKLYVGGMVYITVVVYVYHANQNIKLFPLCIFTLLLSCFVTLTC